MNTTPPPGEELPDGPGPWKSDSGLVVIYGPTEADPYYQLRAKFGPGKYKYAKSKTWPDIVRKGEILEHEAKAGRGEFGSNSAWWLYEQWREAHRDVWSAKHKDGTYRYGQRFVKPAFERIRVDELMMDDFANLLAHKDLTDSTRDKLRTHLTAMVNWGIQRKRIIGKTLDDLIPPKPRVRKAARGGTKRDASGRVSQDVIPTTRQVLDVAAAATTTRVHSKKHARDFTPPDWWCYPILVGAFCGLRMGEMLNLRGFQVQGARLSVIEQVLEAPEEDGGPIKQQTGLPKMLKTRTAVIPTTVGDYPMREWLTARAAAVGPEGLLFPAPKGGIWWRGSFERNLWNPARRLAWGGPRFKFHELRHHAATWLLAQGVPIPDVSLMLGHEDVVTTMRDYVGTSEDSLQRVSDML